MLKGTPFHPRTSTLAEGQAWRRWSGHLVASSYELQHDREYWAIRSSAALFDVSPLFKYHLTGPDAARLLDRMVTRDVLKSSIGQVLYTPWCDPHGKVIDDGTIARLDDQVFRLTSAEPNFRWLHENARGLKVNIEDVSDQLAALSVQGPHARNILKQVCDADLDHLKYFRLTHTRLRGIPVTITRTGFTGDLGYEIWLDGAAALPVWDALLEAGAPYQITPAGMLALDVARVEAGLLLLEVDYISAHHALIESQKSTPYELNLGWAVSVDKGFFNGQAALTAEKARGPAWQFVGIEVDWASVEQLYWAAGLPPHLPAATVRASVPLYANERQVGYASSSCWSPLLKKYIALAHVKAAYAQPGTPLMMEVTVEHQRRQALAHVVKTPFFDPERKRA